MIQVSELKGYNSYRAFCAYNQLLMGLKMIPEYKMLSFEEFFSMLDAIESLEDKRKILTKAAMLVQLEEEELQAMLSFCKDKNGVPYGKENMKNLTPAQQIEAIVSVALEYAKIKVSFVTETEKKN